VIAGYEHFAALARRLQWDEAAIDLAPDAAAWPSLDAERRGRLLALLAGFCVGETAVAGELAPFGDAANGRDAAACFGAQERDERRHAAFFDRVVAEVAGVPGGGCAQRLTAVRERLSPAFLELFEDRLPSVARDLATGDTGLERAVALYHMVLEGVVFTAGQLATLETLRTLPQLSGLREGVELVLRDERWHVGFGSRCLRDAGPGPDLLGAVLEEGAGAAYAWSEVIGEDLATRAVAMLRRRLSAVGARRTTTLRVAP
jgi:ribonucleoside-diphosphate reductase beta chain